MSVTVQQQGSWQAREALRRANEVKRERYRLRCEARHVGATEGMAAGRAVIADALVECPEWLAGADVRVTLAMAPRVGAVTVEWLYGRTGARQRHTVGELSPRQRALLADGLRALGGAR